MEVKGQRVGDAAKQRVDIRSGGWMIEAIIAIFTCCSVRAGTGCLRKS